MGPICRSADVGRLPPSHNVAQARAPLLGFPRSAGWVLSAMCIALIVMAQMPAAATDTDAQPNRIRIEYYPPHGDNKESWDNIDIFGWLGYKMQIKINFLCKDSILAAPIALDLLLFMDLAKRANMTGIQEWLSFYFKSPQTAEGLKPEHDIFKQLIKLQNTLRHMMGEDLITHLGLDYYENVAELDAVS